MTSLPRVLIVEDERSLAIAFAAAVRQAGATSDLAPTAAQARRKLREAGPFDAIILDLGLPDERGLTFLESLPEDLRLPVIVVTAHGEIGNTIAARKLGVREFFTKPLDFESFTRALAELLSAKPVIPPGTVPGETLETSFLGAAAAMRPVFRQIAHACACDEPVLVRGATGTGKTRVAHLLRQHSSRGPDPFEVLGSGRGTGSLEKAIIRARGGFLLIEDLAALSAAEQGSLIEQLEMAGAGTEFPRLIATCGPELSEAVTQGNFRDDLYYRLQVMEIHLPTLLERREDIPALVAFFAGLLAPGHLVELSGEALKGLIAHDWPGNLRELRNIISYALTAGAGSPRIEAAHLPASLSSSLPSGGPAPSDLPQGLTRELQRWVSRRIREDPPPTYSDLSQRLESGLLEELLPHFDGKLARLATTLQANRATLRRKRLNP